jgi:hypothetical protein
MKTLVLIVTIAMAVSSAVYADEPVRQPGAQGIVNTSSVAGYDARLHIIVYPDGGGLEADPDIGQSALRPPDADAPAAIRWH